jgi:hypothetical protein
MIAVIMQPTYLPWLGYFDLMDQADVFVFLDTVQFEHQAWQQRNRIKTSNGTWKWLTVPVVQKSTQRIVETRIDNSRPWARKHFKTIEQYYLKAPFWPDFAEDIRNMYGTCRDLLVDLNADIICRLKHFLGISTKIIRASELPVLGKKVEMLVNMCKYLNADIYLSPARSADYIEQDNQFAHAGITLQYHSYTHPVYRQEHGAFAPYMSVLDLLLNEGPSSTGIIRSGRCNVVSL